MFKRFFKLNKTKKIVLLSFLVFLGLLTHFLFIWHPAEVVFDEVHYGKFANGYLTGENIFSGHPPLGPQLIALGGWIGGYEPHFAFKNIGEKFEDSSYIALRFMPNLFGVFIPLIIYFFLRSLGVSFGLSFLAGILLVFENGLLVQSHFISVDAFLIFFGFLGLTFFFVSRKKDYNWRYFILAGLSLGLGVAVKWTAFSFLFLAGLVFVFDMIRGFFKKRSFITEKKGIRKLIICLMIIPFLVYFGTFWLRFKILTNPGFGDAFMSEGFLSGEKDTIAKFIELNKVNYYSNVKGMTSEHPSSSKLYTWPLMKRPIYYWVNGNSRIYFLGNPIIWWGVALSVLLLIIFLLRKFFKDQTGFILLLGYFVTFLPFIGVSRVVFLYHYLPALIFGVCIMVYLIGKSKHRKRIFIGLLIAVALAFFYFAPLNYGFELTPQQYENRVWLKSWR